MAVAEREQDEHASLARNLSHDVAVPWSDRGDEEQ